MTRSNVSRALVAAMFTAIISTFTLAPASATPAPVIEWEGLITDGASYTYGQVPAAPTCVATEGLVPATCTVTGYDTSVGIHVLTATAVASDGVTATMATRTYTITAWTLKGFYKPVKMNAVNKVKAGSTVPLKFRVYKGAAKATGASVVASLTARQYDCTTLAPIGAPVPVAASHKGLRLKYRDGAFHQNWRTPKLPKAPKAKGKKPASLTACYQITLTTQDASTLTARFLLR